MGTCNPLYFLPVVQRIKIYTVGAKKVPLCLGITNSTAYCVNTSVQRNSSFLQHTAGRLLELSHTPAAVVNH